MTNHNTSIEAEGLKAYLDRTAGQHGGMDYAEYQRLKRAGVASAARARLAGVHRVTMAKYDEIDERELERRSGLRSDDDE